MPRQRPVEFWAGVSSFDLREGLANKAEQLVHDCPQTQDQGSGISGRLDLIGDLVKSFPLGDIGVRPDLTD